MIRRRLYFWEPTLSPHKLALFRALDAHPNVERCVYISQQELSKERQAQGWVLGKLDGLDIRIDPPPAVIEKIVRHGGSNSIHIFSGLHWQPVIKAGIKAVVRQRARFGILCEPRAHEGVRGLARFAHSLATERTVRRHGSFVLAIGRNGPRWFRTTGYSASRIFPFAYFLPAPITPVERHDLSDRLRVGYLGRLTKAKGLRRLLDAFDSFPAGTTLMIAGNGEDSDLVKRRAAKDSGIEYHGVVAMPKVPGFLADIDLLVQPSLTSNDGWAAVVSEALFAGAAVIATSKVGASICLDAPARGMVLSRPDPRLLADAVATLAAGPYLRAEARTARRHWAEARLTEKAGADYLLRILDHVFDGAPRPAPFYD